MFGIFKRYKPPAIDYVVFSRKVPSFYGLRGLKTETIKIFPCEWRDIEAGIQ